MTASSATARRKHSGNLREALQPCAHLLHVTSSKVFWIPCGVGFNSCKLSCIALNLATHKRRTGFALIAESSNELYTLQPMFISAAAQPLALCAQRVGILPTSADFKVDFPRVCPATNPIEP